MISGEAGILEMSATIIVQVSERHPAGITISTGLPFTSKLRVSSILASTSNVAIVSHTGRFVEIRVRVDSSRLSKI